MNLDTRKQLLFEPCETKEELRWHIKAFLNIDLPDYTVDEESTSNAFEFVWSVYETMRTNKGYTSHVAACNRNGAKTLGSAILHFYAMVVFRRDCLQLAAAVDQSNSCLRYLDTFLSIPELQGYSDTSNAKIKSLTNLPPNSVSNRKTAAIRVGVATLKGTNSQRCSFLVADECDLVDARILAEVQGTVDMTAEGYDPILVWLSSRKSNNGPLQDLIDASSDPEKGIRLHKWSIVDWMAKCQPETHKPELPRPKALIDLDTLRVIWDPDEQNDISAANRSKYKEVEAYAGCRKCPAFVACQGRSVKQQSTSSMLRTIRFVGDRFRMIRDSNVLISQYMNLKPEATGVVFRSFSRERHFKEPIAFYKWAIGQRFNPRGLSDAEYEELLKSKKAADRKPITPSKDDIYLALIANGWDISHGVDWGFNPSPATCVVVAYHKKTRRACVIDSFESTGYDNRAWSEFVVANAWKRYPGSFVAPDASDPASASYFARHKVVALNTKPHHIDTGVSQIRGLLWDVGSQSSNFAVLNDGNSDGGLFSLVNSMEKWSHRRSAATGGFYFDKFEDDEFTHQIDALRYALAPYVKEIGVTISAGQPKDSLLDRYRAEQINQLPPEKRAAAIEAHARNQLEDFFKNNHGLENIFNKEQKIKEWESVQRVNAELSGTPLPDEKEDPTKYQRKSGVKISF